MDNSMEHVEFNYCFRDQDDGAVHEVRNSKRKECIGADELCEMFVDFMVSAGYSEQNIWDYFNED